MSTTNDNKLPLYERLVISRVYVALSILFSVLTMVFEPNTYYGHAATVTQIPSFLVLSALALCLLSVIDIVVNDFLSNKYKLSWLIDYRHLIYMGLALLCFSLSAGIIVVYGTTFFLGKLWLDGSIATIVAFLDILGRRGYSGKSIHIQPH